VQVTFHNVGPSPEIEDKILVEAEQLEDFFDRIMSCRVVVDVPHQHRKEGKVYQVRIDLKVPGREIVVKREAEPRAEYRDLDIAIREAFDDARRQLEDHVRRQRGDVKFHDPMPHALVTRLEREAGYGFLETADGREIYFHEHSVLDGGFEHVRVGVEVAFREEEGDKGPQASSVRVVGRRGRAG
jgi:cold shock CspA family protein